MAEEKGVAAVSPAETVESQLYYVRYYSGHTGRYGNEFLEFEISDTGSLKYVNNSNYRNDFIIKKQARVSPAVLEEVKRLILRYAVCESDDERWPTPDRNGRQELEVHLGNTHISLVTNKLTSMADIPNGSETVGLVRFYNFVRDIKALIFALVSIHFKIKPI
ncbi:mago nashi-like protein, putative [Leishmania panamensis]|uniref:Mago nashi-like protein, putative n=3 Tax=Leishmania guyanensis species complex TaxID=38579 RepID=A0A088RX39_LEIPA|nr:mago nashi-like protein, putative [Leishmania panamensis]AIO00574.1 mago nashi-like protein, putative [Leishmania panamensis]CCM17754.1 mago nashi-like protein, putative [Leishmania guyanensis]